MRVKRIGWVGTGTSEYSAMVAFLQAVLGLTTSQEASDFAAFQLPEGGTFEVFGPGDQDHAHFSTGPVVGFVVEDLTGAVRELEAAGVELLGRPMSAVAGGAIFARRTATSTSSPAGSAAVMSPGRMVGGSHLNHLLQPGVDIGPTEKLTLAARFLSLAEPTAADR
jgi:predicted enzyme related to lactoylglutathione lyase